MTTLNPDIFTRRPDFWLMPFLEWVVFFATLLWFLADGGGIAGEEEKIKRRADFACSQEECIIRDPPHKIPPLLTGEGVP